MQITQLSILSILSEDNFDIFHSMYLFQSKDSLKSRN